MPKEFNRKPRSLKELDRWKATELRQFLLYTGPIILKDILDESRYVHFLKLSVSIRILLSDKIEAYNIAEKILKSFIDGVIELYDKNHVTYNTHCLQHLASDAIRIGNLNKFNAFKFENHLQKIKNLVKTKKHIGIQIYNRLAERGKFLEDQIEITANKYYFSIKPPDNMFMAENKVYKIERLERNEKEIYGKEVQNLKSLFEIPISSKLLNIYYTDVLVFSLAESKHNMDDISKCVCS